SFCIMKPKNSFCGFPALSEKPHVAVIATYALSGAFGLVQKRSSFVSLTPEFFRYASAACTALFLSAEQDVEATTARSRHRAGSANRELIVIERIISDISIVKRGRFSRFRTALCDSSNGVFTFRQTPLASAG